MLKESFNTGWFFFHGSGTALERNQQIGGHRA